MKRFANRVDFTLVHRTLQPQQALTASYPTATLNKFIRSIKFAAFSANRHMHDRMFRLAKAYIALASDLREAIIQAYNDRLEQVSAHDRHYVGEALVQDDGCRWLMDFGEGHIVDNRVSIEYWCAREAGGSVQALFDDRWETCTSPPLPSHPAPSWYSLTFYGILNHYLPC